MTTDFNTLTITLQSPHTTTETFPVILSPLRKVWNKVTRKPLPTVTYERPYFHTFSVTEYDDAYRVGEILTRAESLGYTIPSVIVDSDYGTDDLVDGNVPSAAEVTALFTAIAEDDYNWAAYIAHVLDPDYGWTTAMSESWREESYHGSYDSPEEFAQYWAWETEGTVKVVKGPWGDEEHVALMDALPSYLSVDWTDTAENLRGDGFVYLRYNGQTHVFSF